MIQMNSVSYQFSSALGNDYADYFLIQNKIVFEDNSCYFLMKEDGKSNTNHECQKMKHIIWIIHILAFLTILVQGFYHDLYKGWYPEAFDTNKWTDM
jgi:hypothetical protein